MTERHRPRNTMFWRRDENIVAATKHPGWERFHRECGRRGLYFDDIDPVGDSGRKNVKANANRGYGAVAFRVDDNVRLVVARGQGVGPIAAVLDAFHSALGEGFDAPADLANLLEDAPTAASPLDDITGLIG